MRTDFAIKQHTTANTSCPLQSKLHTFTLTHTEHALALKSKLLIYTHTHTHTMYFRVSYTR